MCPPPWPGEGSFRDPQFRLKCSNHLYLWCHKLISLYCKGSGWDKKYRDVWKQHSVPFVRAQTGGQPGLLTSEVTMDVLFKLSGAQFPGV